MNGVMADSVSPGSSQRGARVTWTAHTIWPSGPAAAGSAPSAVLTGAGKVQIESSRARALSGRVSPLITRLLGPKSSSGRTISPRRAAPARGSAAPAFGCLVRPRAWPRRRPRRPAWALRAHGPGPPRSRSCRRSQWAGPWRRLAPLKSASSVRARRDPPVVLTGAEDVVPLPLPLLYAARHLAGLPEGHADLGHDQPHGARGAGHARHHRVGPAVLGRDHVAVGRQVPEGELSRPRRVIGPLWRRARCRNRAVAGLPRLDAPPRGAPRTARAVPSPRCRARGWSRPGRPTNRRASHRGPHATGTLRGSFRWLRRR